MHEGFGILRVAYGRVRRGLLLFGILGLVLSTGAAAMLVRSHGEDRSALLILVLCTALSAAFFVLASRSVEESPLWRALTNQPVGIAAVHFAPAGMVHASREQAVEQYERMDRVASFTLVDATRPIVLRIPREGTEPIIALLLERKPDLRITWDDGLGRVDEVTRRRARGKRKGRG